MTIKERLAEVRERIERAAHESNRDPESITLVAVSKTHTVDAIREAYEAGQRVFGESYAQELAEKNDSLVNCPEIEWHFIGHLQTNKAKLIARHAHVVHTVDSEVLARELAKRVAYEKREALRVLVEVKLSHEPTKHGVRPEDLESVLSAIEKEPLLALRGLMTMPPPDDLSAARKTFETLRSLRSLHGGVPRLPDLSMGMTGDLEVAIHSGATLVRVGTAIFGGRI